MAYSDSLRHFPMVKVVPLTALDGESERVSGTALGGVVSSAIESLEDIRSLWETDHSDGDLKNGFENLRYQLEYLRRYFTGD